MALLEINNVSIAGVITAVPEKIVDNLQSDIFASTEEAEKFVAMTGIRQKRQVTATTCTSDLCYTAAVELLEKLQWDASEIEVLVMVTQTPDYVVPNTSIILQDRLGIPKSCVCFDVPLGCSGYVYGMSILAQFLQTGGLKKGLLLVGDTLSRQCYPGDKTTFPLFGDAGCATALEYEPGKSMKFNLWSDGSGYGAIIVPGGGYRKPFTQDSLIAKADDEGNVRSEINTYMNGTDVFSFGISVVPAELKKFLAHYNIDKDAVDLVFFHQANKFMNETIRKKMALKPEQVPYSLAEYGNTSSATIPVTITTVLDMRNKNILMCGFGVGLSIGIGYAETGEHFVSGLINY